MNKTKLLSLQVAMYLFLVNASFAQKETFASKDWEKDSILKVEDFKGTPDPNSPNISSVAMEISPNVTGISNDSIIFEIVVTFDKYGSWTKAKDHPERFLGAEQMVYDIEEVYARMIRKGMQRIGFTRDNPTDIMDSLTKKYEFGLCYDEIREYGEETIGNKDTIEVRKWHNRVRRELDSLSAYKNPVVRIKFYKDK